MSDATVTRAIELLEQAKQNIIERGNEYNGSGVGYPDYQLRGIDSTWHSILECFVRLWKSKKPDKAADWVAYSALQAAMLESGVPQSKFALAYGSFKPQIDEIVTEARQQAV